MGFKSHYIGAFLLCAVLLSSTASATNQIDEKITPYPPDEGQIVEQALSGEEMYARRKAELQKSAEANEIVEVPLELSISPRASYTWPIDSWAANSEHILTSDVELSAGEKVTFSGSWNNPNARMKARFYIMRNGAWAIVGGTTFGSGSSNWYSVLSAGYYKITVIPDDFIGGGSVTIKYGE